MRRAAGERGRGGRSGACLDPRAWVGRRTGASAAVSSSSRCWRPIHQAAAMTDQPTIVRPASRARPRWRSSPIRP
ncbi:unnamed protein product, partial [Ixodes pacificus]